MKKFVIKIIMWTLIAVVAITVFWTINRKGATLNVSEAFFHHIFIEKKDTVMKGEAFFLEIEDKDPSPGFLARFKNYSPPVKKGSEVRYDSLGLGGVKGIVVNIDSYKWYGNIVVIHGRLYMGPLGMETGDYTWIQIAGKWIFLSYTPGVWA